MLDIKFIRENPQIVKKAVADKQLAQKVDIDKFLELDKEYLNLLQKVELHRTLRNQLSENIGKVEPQDRPKLIEEATKVKEELAEMETIFKNLEIAREAYLKTIPNLISPEVPYGEGEDDNKVIRKWGEPTKFDFEPKDHLDLGIDLGIIDMEKAGQIVGARFNYLFGAAAQIQFALINWVFSTLTDPEVIKKLADQVKNPNAKPFVPVVPPVFVRTDVMDRMDRLEPQDERYIFEKDGLALVGSAEHTLGPLHMNETLSTEILPIRYIGYSTAFRREAGSYGKDIRGILRVHQFDKLEMESFSTPETGQLEQDLFVAVQEYMMQQLKIPYDVMLISTGDMGKPDYRQIDINAWLPGQNKYRETHTSDYMTDYQARRLNIKTNKGDFVHMNDATAFPIGRILIAILENYQQEDGSVLVPEVLQKFVGFTKIEKTN